MMLLAYLIRTGAEWREVQVRVNLVVPDPAGAAAARGNLLEIIEKLRIGAAARVIVSEGRPFPEILREASADADLVFLGLAVPENVPDFTSYYEGLQKRARGLPTTAFVLASEEMEFSEVLL